MAGLVPKLGLFSILCLVLGRTIASGFGDDSGDFLSGVSPSAFFQFQQICQNGTLTKSEVAGQLQSWAQSNGVSTQFANATGRLQQRQQELQSLANSNLAGQALQLFNQIYAILTNDGITRLAECQGIRAAGNATNGTQREIRRLVPVPPCSIPCPFYPPQCFRNIVPFAMPGRDMASPDIEVNFVQMPENIQPHPSKRMENQE